MTQPDIPLIPLVHAEGGLPGFYVQKFEHYRVVQTAPFPSGLPHRHLHFEMFWITSGFGLVMGDFEHIRVRPGTLLLINPGDVHAWVQTRKMSGMLLGFTRGFIADHGALSPGPLSPSLWRPGGLRALHVASPEDHTIDHLLNHIREESLSGDPARGDVVKSLLCNLIHKARRLSEEGEPAAPETALTQRFRLSLQTECPKLGTVKQFAQHLQVSRSLLHRRVRRDTGRPPSDLIHERLLLEAKRRLLHSDATLGEIARQLGFADSSYFGRFFHRHSGLTPRAYRAGGNPGKAKASPASSFALAAAHS